VIRKIGRNERTAGLLLWAITLLAFAHVGYGNEFRLLDDDRMALEARVRLLENARHEIVLSHYAIDTGDVPIGLIQLLRHAACRGVRVRVLADGLKSRLPSDLEKLLAAEGIEIRLYHPPFKAHPEWLNRRLHHKLLVVDRCHMVIGSRNLQDHHFGLDAKNFVDCDAYFHGEISRCAAEYFDWLWRSGDVLSALESNSFGIDFKDDRRMGLPVGRSMSPRRVAALNDACASSLTRMLCRSGIELGTGGEVLMPQLCQVQVSLIYDADTAKSQQQVQRQHIAMIDAASSSIYLESPYPIFSEPVRCALERARARGVQVELLTNSLQSSNLALPYAGYQNGKRGLLKSGICLHEYIGKGHHHVKCLVVDDCIAKLGSYNFDERSDYLNLELCVRIDDPRVATLLKQSAWQRLQRSESIQMSGLRAEVGGDVPAQKIARLRTSQLLVPLMRNSL
jgi:cardiolipin synthase C